MRKYYRIDIIEEHEIINVLSTFNKEEAERTYYVWAETHGAVVFIENDLDTTFKF